MRTSRRWVRALVVTIMLVVGLSTAAVVATQTAWFKNWLRGYIVREAHQYLNGQLSIERLGGNLFFGLEMENIGLSMDGSQVVAVRISAHVTSSETTSALTHNGASPRHCRPTNFSMSGAYSGLGGRQPAQLLRCDRNGAFDLLGRV